MEGRVWESENDGENEEGEKKESKLPDLRVQMERVPWPNERMHDHVRFLFDQLRGRDTSWTDKQPKWGHNVSSDPTILPIMCVCQECDQVHERRNLYLCMSPSCPSVEREHFVCNGCYKSMEENGTVGSNGHHIIGTETSNKEREQSGSKERVN